jgi:2-amino-4-hydroxy-6-hydroxymethyldihydropteridine diphosphokinase
MTQVFVAIGSNVDPLARMQQVARALKLNFPGARFSRVYRNPAFGFVGADFLNAVVGFDSALSIAQLLRALRAIETECGRGPADPKWGPRAIDLDLLLYGELVAAGAGYTLPRRDLLQRVYMLGPLAELAPDTLYPPSGPALRTLWEQLSRSAHVLSPLELDLNVA